MNRSEISPWIRIAAYTVPLSVLPSALWRVYFVASGQHAACPAHPAAWYEPIYIISLSVISFGASLLTLGLVSEWGEIFPRWIPLIGGKRVAVMAAVGPASIGIVFLAFLYGWPWIIGFVGTNKAVIPPGCQLPWEGPNGWVVLAAYAPILLWAPLLAVVTWSYYLRRTGRRNVEVNQNAIV